MIRLTQFSWQPPMACQSSITSGNLVCLLHSSLLFSLPLLRSLRFFRCKKPVQKSQVPLTFANLPRHRQVGFIKVFFAIFKSTYCKPAAVLLVRILSLLMCRSLCHHLRSGVAYDTSISPARSVRCLPLLVAARQPTPQRPSILRRFPGSRRQPATSHGQAQNAYGHLKNKG